MQITFVKLQEQHGSDTADLGSKQMWAGTYHHQIKIWPKTIHHMVGPRDGGFGFDQSKKYSSVDNLEQICVQCQAGQHAKCLAKTKEIPNCECEHCIVFG